MKIFSFLIAAEKTTAAGLFVLGLLEDGEKVGVVGYDSQRAISAALASSGIELDRDKFATCESLALDYPPGLDTKIERLLASSSVICVVTRVYPLDIRATKRTVAWLGERKLLNRTVILFSKVRSGTTLNDQDLLQTSREQMGEIAAFRFSLQLRESVPRALNIVWQDEEKPLRLSRLLERDVYLSIQQLTKGMLGFYPRIHTPIQVE
jgi:MinD-like ATPase involved in chromosome partitioning or flagellar assembly